MARSSSDINTIIAELTTARNTRDASIETAASALDGSNDKNAARLRSLKHITQIANGIELCYGCRLIKDSDGNPIGMSHDSFYIEDTTLGTESVPGLRSLLADESFSIAVSTTVSNL